VGRPHEKEGEMDKKRLRKLRKASFDEGYIKGYNTCVKDAVKAVKDTFPFGLMDDVCLEWEDVVKRGILLLGERRTK